MRARSNRFTVRTPPSDGVSAATAYRRMPFQSSAGCAVTLSPRQPLSLTNNHADNIDRKVISRTGRPGGNPLVAPQQTHHLLASRLLPLLRHRHKEVKFLHQLINTISLASTRDCSSALQVSPASRRSAAHPGAHPFPVTPTPPAVKHSFSLGLCCLVTFSRPME